MMEKDDDVIVLVSNIPVTYHTSDLRRFFADFIEQKKLTCFHFRHRVEKKKTPECSDENSVHQSESQTTSENNSAGISNDGASTSGDVTTFSRQVTARVHKTREDDTSADRSGDGGASHQNDDKFSRQNIATCCCLVKVVAEHVNAFISSFHRKHWLDSDDCEMPLKCLVAKIAIEEQRDLKNLPELRPPNIMPQGNVGTPTKFFLDAIRDCRLPAKLIGKLKLEFPKGRYRKYGTVPFQYEEKEGQTLTSLTSVNRKKLQDMNTKGPMMENAKEDSDPEDDDDTCEEWERHEALHDDVQPNRTIGRQVNSSSYLAEGGDLEQQPGTKQKAFEDEIELVWEKGGSGLNFYTDVQFWKTQESQDFDEQTTDDWDVDMSVYYDKDTNYDKDAEDRLSMRTSEFLRAGKHEESVFARKKSVNNAGKRPWNSKGWGSGAKRPKGLGAFEMHSRGVGSHIMSRAGWKEGDGLGPKRTGMPEALDGEEDGQRPRDKSGLGYHGERIIFAPKVPAQKNGKLVQGASTSSGDPSTSSSTSSQWIPPPPPGSRISSCYTDPKDLDPPERVDRSNPQLYMKFRDQSIKFHSGGTQGGSKD